VARMPGLFTGAPTRRAKAAFMNRGNSALDRVSGLPELASHTIVLGHNPRRVGHPHAEGTGPRAGVKGIRAFPKQNPSTAERRVTFAGENVSIDASNALTRLCSQGCLRSAVEVHGTNPR